MVHFVGLVAFALSLSSTALAISTHAPLPDASSPSTFLATEDASRPAGIGRIVENDVNSGETFARRAAEGAGYYTALVAFGASYTDNAHARPAKYAGSLRHYAPYDKYGGRYTNGPVAVEYMVKASTKPALPQKKAGVKLLDYAYGGSVVQNGLAGTNASWPASRDQVASFLADLKKGKAAVGPGRTLFYFNSGINPVNPAEAERHLGEHIRSINTNANVARKINGADYLVVGIPQMEIVPSLLVLAPAAHHSKALALLKALSDQYNKERPAFVKAFQGEVKSGNALWFDLAGLWKSMTNWPGLYGIKAGTTPCYNSSTGAVCENPSQFLYFDTLHPVTTIHKLMAEKMNAVVARSRRHMHPSRARGLKQPHDRPLRLSRLED
ncbi:hypothetical protein JCM10296v2_006820 [Rhodotorula toruloides]